MIFGKRDNVAPAEPHELSDIDNDATLLMGETEQSHHMLITRQDNIFARGGKTNKHVDHHRGQDCRASCTTVGIRHRSRRLLSTLQPRKGLLHCRLGLRIGNDHLFCVLRRLLPRTGQLPPQRMEARGGCHYHRQLQLSMPFRCLVLE